MSQESSKLFDPSLNIGKRRGTHEDFSSYIFFSKAINALEQLFYTTIFHHFPSFSPNHSSNPKKNYPGPGPGASPVMKVVPPPSPPTTPSGEDLAGLGSVVEGLGMVRNFYDFFDFPWNSMGNFYYDFRTSDLKVGCFGWFFSPHQKMWRFVCSASWFFTHRIIRIFDAH